ASRSMAATRPTSESSAATARGGLASTPTTATWGLPSPCTITARSKPSAIPARAGNRSPVNCDRNERNLAMTKNTRPALLATVTLVLDARVITKPGEPEDWLSGLLRETISPDDGLLDWAYTPSPG